MSRFGQNPYGQNLYRIVYAPSRRYLVVGEWPDGSQCAQWVVKHKGIGDQWIMERWLPAEQYAKCTREQWDQTMLILGPWPARGEYEHCHTFELSTPTDANIEKLIKLIEASRQVRFQDTLNWHREDAARERESIRKTAEDMIRNRLPAFGGRPMSAGKYGRTTKIPTLRTAQELGLPRIPGRPKKGEVSRNVAYTVPRQAA